MTTTFLERNKKKSLLAALLLFLRQRKTLVLLLLLVVMASTLFLSPSSMLTGLPGGTRVAAGVAWVAQRLGVDVSRWGLAGGGDRRSFDELLAAFRTARSGTGWGSFFRAGAGTAMSPGSLDFVKGSRTDLEGARSGAIAGVIDPDQAKKLDAGVQLSEGDVGGQRESFVKNAFAGGFVTGLVGDGGSSGMAYAGKGFFNHGLAASSPAGAAARNGLQGGPPASMPKSQFQGGVGGRLTYAHSAAIDARSKAGVMGAASLGPGKAFTQLAQGRGQAELVSPSNCGAGCPGEFAATNSAAIYDGNPIKGGGTDILTAPQVDGTSAPNIPDSGIGQAYIDQANQMAADAQKCKDAEAQYGPQEQTQNQQLQDLSQQFQDAGCGSGGGCSQSKKHHCENLGSQMRGVCTQYQQLLCAQTKACPLSASRVAASCGGECKQVGDGIHTQQIVVNPDDPYNSDGAGYRTVTP